MVDLGRKGTSQVNGRAWDINDWTCFIVTAWMVINLSVGSRKGESTKLPGDVAPRASLLWTWPMP